MSEQSKILEEMHQLVMNILKSGVASEAEGDRLDELEELMFKQKCYKEIDNADYDYLGEEIAALFFNNLNAQAIDKMYECEITPEDFFGFAEYHFEDEPLAEMFTNTFIADVDKTYRLNLESNK